MNNDPVVAEVTRGGIVESQHRGAIAVVGPGGKLLASRGNIGDPVFPRSAIKAFQCLPAIEAGVVEAFGMSDEEIALACASHNGEAEHVRVARSALAKAHVAEDLYECGPQWPTHGEALRDLVRAGGEALPVHRASEAREICTDALDVVRRGSRLRIACGIRGCRCVTMAARCERQGGRKGSCNASGSPAHGS
jgi:L-asparaginase II